jgi:hypothetical protein
MKNPVPEVALPYVCEYLRVMLDCLRHPQDGITGAEHRYVVEQTGMPLDLAFIIERYLHERGFTVCLAKRVRFGVTAWCQLSARGYLTALELCEHGG